MKNELLVAQSVFVDTKQSNFMKLGQFWNQVEGKHTGVDDKMIFVVAGVKTGQEKPETNLRHEND